MTEPASVTVSTRPARRPPSAAQIGFILFAVLSVGVSMYGFSYLSDRQAPPGVRENGAGMVTLALHAVSAGVALLLGPFQFVAKLRTQRRRLHRWIGRTYCAACLLGGVSGAALAFGGATGDVARLGFGLLAACWLAATALAWASAVTGDFARHRVWMVRSFAMTFAAVTLRIYLGVAMASGLAFDQAYPAIAWLAWVPNLIVAEIWLRRPRRLAA